MLNLNPDITVFLAHEEDKSREKLDLLLEKQFGPIPESKVTILQTGSCILDGKMPPQILRVTYIRLPISDPLRIRYEVSQGGILKTVENFQEGTLFVRRKLFFSIQDFLAVALNSISHWRDSGVFHMTHGDSPAFNKLRNLSFKLSDSKEMIDCEIVKPRGDYSRYFDRENEGQTAFLVVPLECVVRQIVDYLKQTQTLLVPRNFASLVPEMKAYLDYQMREFPTQYLGDFDP